MQVPHEIPSDDRREKRKKLAKKVGRATLDRLSRFYTRQSLIGGEPVFNKDMFPWLEEFEANWQAVRGELEQVLEQSARLPAFHEVSPDQKRISKGDQWKVFPFYVFGQPHVPNCQRCPVTHSLLEKVPELENAMFSILSPHYRIPMHRGPTNGLVRIHLGLIVPDQADACQIRVGDRVFGWQEGKCVVFDDHFEHEVWNNTEQTRVVLFFDVDRPMRPLGRLVNRLMIAIMRRTAYVTDARDNLAALSQADEPS